MNLWYTNQVLSHIKAIYADLAEASGEKRSDDILGDIRPEPFTSRRAIAGAIARRFPWSSMPWSMTGRDRGRTSRPVQTKACDGSLEAISYAFKTEFVQRIAYRGQTNTKGKSRECWMTRKVSLSPIDHADLLVWLHSIGLGERLYLRGVRMTMTSNGVALAKVKKQE
jgi:hypothetical protein